jgi:hypothetical protein
MICVENRSKDLIFGAEMVVHAAHCDSGDVGNLAHAGAVETVLGKEIVGHFQQSGTRDFTSGRAGLSGWEFLSGHMRAVEYERTFTF